jgi:hypothetical protein
MELNVLGQTFSTQTALREFVRQMLHSHDVGRRIGSPDHEFLEELLSLHPSAVDKRGCGVGHFEVRINSPYGKSTRGFWIIRLDKTEIDFSYLECIKATSHESKVKSAMRHAIWPQVLTYKEKYFGDSRQSACEETGEPITWEQCHVDHRPPKTFDVIVRRFLDESALAYTDIEVRTGSDKQQIGDRLLDESLELQWITFHRMHCDLMCIRDTVNLRRKRV